MCVWEREREMRVKQVFECEEHHVPSTINIAAITNAFSAEITSIEYSISDVCAGLVAAWFAMCLDK